MAARGITTPEEGELFLTPSLERDWARPEDIPGLVGVVDRIEAAICAGETIAIFGDFDVDGITSTCLMTEGLRALGAHVEPFIPHRFDEGYGLSQAALERVVNACHPQLIVTVDNGIAARDEVAFVIDQDIDLVITDHHEPSDAVPEAVPLTDPKLMPDGPSHELAGAGVALKVVQLLGERLGQPNLWRSLVEVAALGTVSDMMTLTPENRALVSAGITQMRATSRPGYISLAVITKTDLSTITADGLSFSLIPRLNAAGRMADPTLALNLLLERDPVRAGELAMQLEEINQERRSIEADLTSQALAEVERTYTGGRVIVVGGEGWHEGVKGIVASRIVNRYHVPALLFSINNGVAHGSGRSVGRVNLFAAIEQCSDLLLRFGGHAGAVGVTLEADKLDEFRVRLDEVLSKLPAETFEDITEIATTVTLDELTLETIERISDLEPFGQGNKIPLLAATGVTMSDRAAVGKAGDHVRFVATDGSSSVPAIMFRVPDVEKIMSCDSVVDLVFEAVAEHWAGRVKPKLMVRDIMCRDNAEMSAPAPNHVAALESHLYSEPQQREYMQSIPVKIYERTITTEATACREKLSHMNYAELTNKLVEALLGAGCVLHPAQAEALNHLAAHHNTLAIMGTGRGKSLIFQVHAAREAIAYGNASIFVYPLRALIADQAYHLADHLAPLGLRVAALTGETTSVARDSLFGALAAGKLDIVLTTPEFLAIHADRFEHAGRIGFITIDEAHHIAGAKGGDRSAYLELPRIVEMLKYPCVLAATATANTQTTHQISALLSIDRVVIDDAVRPNLDLEDDRNLTSRENRLVSIVAQGEKCVVYVNSRDQSVALARMLRHRVPELAGAVAFYNGALPRDDRARVEQAFRAGELTCIVSTSAFGEGVNLPDIRHVVLYHMPFSATEFNQMSGRAGRDGDPALIHLLYSARDARINERILDAAAPERDELVVLYRALQTMCRAQRSKTGSAIFDATDTDIAGMCSAIDMRCRVDPRAVDAGMAIFQELGFLSVSHASAGHTIEMIDSPEHMALTSSILYLEGLRARRAFANFRSWALDAPARDMLQHITHPITPDR